MSTTYNGVPGNQSPSAAPTITIPVDGDLANAASMTVSVKALADMAALIQTALTSCLLFGGASGFNVSTTTQYLTPGGVIGVMGTVETFLVVPKAGRISNMQAVCSTGSTTQGWTIFVRQNAVNSALTQTVATGALTGNDTTHSFTVAAGDKISVSYTAISGCTVAPINVGVSMLYTMA